MIRIFILLVLLLLSGRSQSLAKGVVMEDIADAGIYCATGIGGFYELVERRCKGKSSCTVKATMIATKQELLQSHCTGFFVAPVCRGRPVSIESRYDVFKTLLVSCKK